MSLINDFCFAEILNQSDGSLNCALRFDPAHPIFQGHFPGMPIVPGVCSVELMRELLELALQKDIQLKKASNIKFLGLLRPEDRPVAELSWKEVDGTIQLQASMKVDEKAVFKMQGVMVLPAL